jgi:hypothetical protein
MQAMRGKAGKGMVGKLKEYLATVGGTGNKKTFTFSVLFEGVHGHTCEVENPKIAAYQSMAYIANVLGRNYQLVCHEDGCYTVSGDGLESTTFAPISS